MAFKVVNIIDGATVQVEGWKLGDDTDATTGNLIRISGLEKGLTSEFSEMAKSRLEILLKNREIDLKKVVKVEELNGKSTLICSAFLEGIEVTEYFPEYRKK